MTWTLGIDLASQHQETAACIIDWENKQLVPVGSVLGADKLNDAALLALMRDDRVSKVAIDAPFGWPLAFVDALVTFRDRIDWPGLDAPEVHFRTTELHVQTSTGQRPMSAAMTNLAWPTVRCARLLSALMMEGIDVDRRGGGQVAEVYPAAGLLRWQLSPARSLEDPGSYKGPKADRRARRVLLVAALTQALDGTLKLSAADTARCEDDDDDLDALICALLARAIELGHCDPIPRGLHWVATREGWIHLPTQDSLTSLATAT